MRRRRSSGRDDTRLSERGRELLPLLRCPVTGEALVESPGGGLRSADSGHPWPVVAGRPVLFPGVTVPVVHPDEHSGNPLPERALALAAQVDGRILHLSGGGTAVGAVGAVELDAAVYAPTDVVGDAHRLPFVDEAFDLVIAMNAFEHYRDPRAVVAELQRVLRPGGRVFVHTAFLQPVHEAPHHYYNCTRYGLEEWFRDFETVDLRVSDNFEPAYALSWLAAEAQDLLAAEASPEAAAEFVNATVGEVARFWRDPDDRGHARWAGFAELAPESRERLAAGFEYLGRRPR